MPINPDDRAWAEPARDVYSVTRVNREVRVLLERGLGVLWVEGELSNFSQPASGHWYFSLKDRDAQLRCAMFRMKNSLVGFTPRAGAQVLVRGRISVYEARGEYQLIVEHLEEAGIGALRREFERLKAKLAAEGLFALECKRSLPRFPQRIGVITSPSGAALRDILHVLARRYPPAAVLIYPTAVQGAAAVPALVAALQSASARAECEVLILARGGGSLEDLWAFNDERVARAIRACRLPVVSGVGHEIDFTIADLAADARAPTPSGAAELVVPDRSACLEVLARTAQRLGAGMRRELRVNGARFEGTERRLKLAHPGVRLHQQMQRLDDLAQRLGGAARAGLHRDQMRVAQSITRLVRRSPDHVVREYRARHQGVEARLEHAAKECLSRAQHRLALAQRALNAISPLATLTRGFAIVTRAAGGTLLTDAAAVAAGEEIEARLARGSLRARVTARNQEG
ncbi:MAG TPA: exodeoxyribonuclease VII large subunit [Steroidobacteraceae bacterium]|nr:exodeoxyribonuclease VII large subunit [Steroidobacteraceae bacterium]